MPAATGFRVVLWQLDFGARGPGKALADILAKADGPTATAQIIAQLAPDLLVLTGVDYDLHHVTLNAFADLVETAGHALPHRFAPRPNSGMPTGLDLNNDGQRYGPDDAHGYGEYPGAGAIAVLSRYPFVPERSREFTTMLWRELPDALLYSGAQQDRLADHRLSSSAHLALAIRLPNGTDLEVLLYNAGPPVFGFHPDRNLHRNHDETAFWLHLLDGALPFAPPTGPFVLVGGSDLDPVDGDGMGKAMRTLLAHPALQDPRPASPGGAMSADPSHRGPPELDTVDWDDPQGNLRVSYILPSADLRVSGTGVLWPLPESALAAQLSNSGTAHKPVWVDLVLN